MQRWNIRNNDRSSPSTSRISQPTCEKALFYVIMCTSLWGESRDSRLPWAQSFLDGGHKAWWFVLSGAFRDMTTLRVGYRSKIRDGAAIREGSVIVQVQGGVRLGKLKMHFRSDCKGVEIGE